MNDIFNVQTTRSVLPKDPAYRLALQQWRQSDTVWRIIPGKWPAANVSGLERAYNLGTEYVTDGALMAQYKVALEARTESSDWVGLWPGAGRPMHCEDGDQLYCEDGMPLYCEEPLEDADLSKQENIYFRLHSLIDGRLLHEAVSTRYDLKY